MTLHLSHIGFTEGLTFIFFLLAYKIIAPDGSYLLRQVILPLVKS